MGFCVVFECSCHQTEWGDVVRVVGDLPELGNWDPKHGITMNTTQIMFPQWKSSPCRLSNESNFQFKFVIVEKNKRRIQWEPTENRTVLKKNLSDNHTTITVQAQFGRQGIRINALCPSRVPVTTSVLGIDDQIGRTSYSSSDYCIAPHEDPEPQYRGSTLSKHHHNQYSSIINGHRDAGSFLQKLQLIQTEIKVFCSMIQPGKDQAALKLTKEAVEKLSSICIYLTFVRSGALQCREDGGHHRPNHHAQIASFVFLNLLHVLQQFSKNTKVYEDEYREIIILLVRRILPLLPSFSEGFTCSVPLTRIRDIAHRNDISQNLKTEIKNTLQNKLHRCAGPEDLITAIKLHDRLSKTKHELSQSFFSEFEIFLKELKEFFNAQSLVDYLMSIQNMNEIPFQLIEDFLKKKCAVNEYHDHANDLLSSVNKLSEILDLSVEIRIALNSLKNKKSLSSSKLQLIWLTDIALEQYVFILFSQIANEVINQFHNNYDDQRMLPFALFCMTRALQHIQLNGFHEEECAALIKSCELFVKWIALNRLQFTEYEKILFLRSVLERTTRLTEKYTDTILSLFPSIAIEMGNALEVPKHAAHVFAEADVRANLIFQLSRLSSTVTHHVAKLLGETGLEIIVHPTTKESCCFGKLIVIEDLWQVSFIKQQKGPKKIILCLLHVTGDEEISGLQRDYNICAIILLHSIPYLSHLSIRARQEKLPFVTVIDKKSQLVDQINKLKDKDVELKFNGANEVELFETKKQLTNNIETASQPTEQISTMIVEVAALPSFDHKIKDDGDAPLPFFTTTDITCTEKEQVGTKAATCAKLFLAGADGLFKVPNCWILPFGCMESVLHQFHLFDQYHQLLNEIDCLILPSEETKLDLYLSSLHDVMSRAVPNEKQLELFMNSLKSPRHKEVSFITRSSANVEDLPNMSAAGLYESIVNVNCFRDFDRFARSIMAVWSSLHSRRAILSRHSAKIPQTSARMAVLVQELVNPYLSFVIHTVCPLTSLQRIISKEGFPNYCPADWIYVEMALGLGEILASGSVRGLPYRMVIHKKTDCFIMVSWASFGIKFEGTDKKISDIIESKPTATEFVDTKTCVYNSDIFTLNHKFRHLTARKLRLTSMYLEETFANPQDIEGSIVLGSHLNFSTIDDNEEKLISLIANKNIFENDFEIVVVQSRPQSIF